MSTFNYRVLLYGVLTPMYIIGSQPPVKTTYSVSKGTYRDLSSQVDSGTGRTTVPEGVMLTGSKDQASPTADLYSMEAAAYSVADDIAHQAPRALVESDDYWVFSDASTNILGLVKVTDVKGIDNNVPTSIVSALPS